MQPIGAHCCEVMYFGCLGFRGELGFRNCDDVCMCVVNKQFELLEFVSESVYVDLQYDEISLTFSAGPVSLCGVSSPWSVCEVVVVPYVVCAVVAVTVMHVLLFVLHVCVLRECPGARVSAVLVWVERVVSGCENWVWALPILWGQGECWTCVCVLVAVVWVV